MARGIGSWCRPLEARSRERPLDPQQIVGEQRGNFGQSLLGAHPGRLGRDGAAERVDGRLDTEARNFCDFLSFQILVKEVWGSPLGGSTRAGHANQRPTGRI